MYAHVYYYGIQNRDNMEERGKGSKHSIFVSRVTIYKLLTYS